MKKIILLCVTACISLLLWPQQGESVFKQALWIGAGDGDLPLYAHYLPVYKIKYNLQFESFVSKAGFMYGANDRRLMDKYKNVHHLQNPKDSSYILVEWTLTAGQHYLNIYRVGYHPDDKKEIPLASFPIPEALINQQNQLEVHTFHIHSHHGHTTFYIDGQSKEHLVGSLRINPSPTLSFPVLGDIGFSISGGSKGLDAKISGLEIYHYRSPSSLIRKVDFSNCNDKLGFYLFDPSQNSMPLLRTSFTLKQKPLKAELLLTARGIYQPYLNDQRIGDEYFNPGHTQYNKTLFYQTYDLSELVHKGKNTLQVQLAEGWWSGASTFLGELWNFYGDRNSLLASLIVHFQNGTADTIVSTPANWEYSSQSPVVYGSLFQGEVYHAGIKTGPWKPAVEVETEKTVSTARGDYPAVDDYSRFKLLKQIGPAVKPFDTLKAIAVEKPAPNIFIYDMGQNMVGVPRIVFSKLKNGQKITFRYAEVKYPDLPEYKNNVGEMMLENIREAMAQDIYIAHKAKAVYSPQFTCHGYRYLEITGLEQALPLGDVQGIVLSSVERFSAHYECSNPKVNRLWENIKWSMLGNFLSIPTDCPQRNERLGWSGDISVFSKTAVYLAPVHAFLNRHLLSLRDLQREDGRFPDIAPIGIGFGGLLWGSAGITVTWENYCQYNDSAMLARHYPAMKQYIDFIQQKCIDPRSGILVQEDPGYWGNLGDWLGPEQEKNDNSLLWECYFLYDLDLMRKMAGILGKTVDEDYFSSVFQRRKAFFNATYIDPKSGKTICSGFAQNKKGMEKGKLLDTQTSYALPLAFGLVDEAVKPMFIKNFTAGIERENRMDQGDIAPPYSLLTGFIGTAWINHALSEAGRCDVAYRLLQQTSYPSWLYPVEQGATTIWERLNSYTHERGFGGNNGMNSFNHYSFGAVGAWMMEYSLGIKRDDASPGFRHFILQPQPDPTREMDYAQGYFDSPCGRIESAWKIDKQTVHYRFVVPPNTTATLKLKLSPADSITSQDRAITTVSGIRYLGQTKGCCLFELKPGVYKIDQKVAMPH
ncbi:MAG: family 78 glycoside hydrolase catalytic domain [Bacteroidales bacterium]|nr:family 78 glycoside hydrolase catalytic domain [Bacteroidales bacterium]